MIHFQDQFSYFLQWLTSFLFRNGSGPHLDSISLNSYMLSYILYFEKYKFAKSGFR